jgi:GT2 family glycosyltransferase
MLDLSIVIVNYNTKEFLKKCINSLLYCISKKVNYEIIIVDNASSDGSSSEISNFKSQISNLKIILNKENFGFAKANNQGIKISQESRYVLFLNSDTIMQQETIEEMINFMDTHKNVGASTCRLVMPNGKIDDASHRGFPTPWNSFSYFLGLSRIFPKSRIFTGYNLGWMNLEKAHEIDALAGAFMLVRREAGEQAGWWDEDYFFYGEDIDFCYMLKEKGWKIYYVPKVFITHYKGVSGGIKAVSKGITTASKETKKRVTFWRFKAMKIFYRKHYENKYPRIITWLTYMGIFLKEKLSSL